MKYLKNYVIFEGIHALNTNINELSNDFVYDINDICSVLNDHYPQNDGSLVKFYSTHFRRSDKNFQGYPSISIRMPWYAYGYKFGNTGNTLAKDSELKEVALRIKDYLGDAYIGFLIDGINVKINLSDKTSFWSGINGFQIVYDPNKIRSTEEI